jgi:hypothetical protein
MIDLKKLEQRFDKLLSTETEETFNNWLQNHRKNKKMGYLTDGLTFRTLRNANVRRFAKFVSQFKRRGTMKNELILWLRATCIFVLAILIISAVTLIILMYPIVFVIAFAILASITFISLIKNEL